MTIFTGKNGGRNNQTLELPKEVREAKVWTTGSWSQYRTVSSVAHHDTFSCPQLRQQCPPLPQSVWPWASSVTSLCPRSPAVKEATQGPARTGPLGAPGQDHKSSSTEWDAWEKEWVCKMYKRYNNSIADKLPTVTGSRALTYIEPECGFVLSVVS